MEIDELADSVLVAALGVWTVGAAAADDGYQVNQAGCGVSHDVLAPMVHDKKLEHNQKSQIGTVPGPSFHTCI
jgi:hypothetical protein